MIPAVRKIQIIMKISKLCNLRCQYCYELNELHDRRAMSRDDLRAIYRNMLAYYTRRDQEDGLTTEIVFIWHGGEPLLQKPEFYWETFADQREILGDRFVVKNAVQTNLTQLDGPRLALLRDGFSSVGVSLDVFGGHRVDIVGKDRQARTLRNMDVLREAGVAFGCIVVLTARNLDRLGQICSFFERSQLAFKVLPLHKAAFEGQVNAFELTTADILAGYKTLVDRWFAADSDVEIEPIRYYIRYVVRHMTRRGGADAQYFDKRRWNTALIVNTNGDCYCAGDPYGEPASRVGNLIHQDIGALYASAEMDRSLRSAEERIAYNCTRCQYFGSCSGFYIAEGPAYSRERGPTGISICAVERRTLEYIEARLRAANLPNDGEKFTRLESRVNDALAVA